MLVEFRVTNFKCFKDEATLSFVSTKSKEHPNHVAKQGKFNLLRSCVLYGANGSGKTKFMEACQYFISLLQNSPSHKDGVPLNFPVFSLDPECKNKPISFEVTFIIDGDQFQYGFSFLPSGIFEEFLYSNPKNGRNQLWFERDDKGIKFGDNLKGKKKFDLNDNQLYLPIAKDNKQLNKVFEYFKKWKFIYTTEELLNYTCKLIHDNQGNINFKKLVDSFLQQIDLGIESVLVTKRSIEDIDLNAVPDFIRESIERNVKANGFYDVMFQHKSEFGSTPIPLGDESKGTREIFSMLGPIIAGLKDDNIMFFDEFNHHLHPILSTRLLDMFHNSKDEKGEYGKSQFILNALDTNILDPEVLRHDQVWFTEKNGDSGITSLYSLAEFKTRSTTTDKNYMEGKYGAVPIIKKFAVNLQTSTTEELLCV